MKLLAKAFLFGFCFLFLFTAIIRSQVGIVDRDASNKPTLVVFGTYHMGTPGRNVVNSKVDDISTPERQKQVVALVDRLKKFRPTKIAVECDIEDDAKTKEIYDRYLSGNYKLSKNETNQIGFRLAKKLGHKKVYCVDWGEFPKDPLYNYEKYASNDPELDRYLKAVYQRLKREIDTEFEKLFSLPVTDQLIHLNQSGRIEKDHQGYFDLMRIGRGNEYVGANYLSWWYGRNMKILVNIIRITDSPNDRVLVVYGAGHSKLLNQLARESGFYDVENPLKYLAAKK